MPAKLKNAVISFVFLLVHFLVIFKSTALSLMSARSLAVTVNVNLSSIINDRNVKKNNSL